MHLICFYDVDRRHCIIHAFHCFERLAGNFVRVVVVVKIKWGLGAKTSHEKIFIRVCSQRGKKRKGLKSGEGKGAACDEDSSVWFCVELGHCHFSVRVKLRVRHQREVASRRAGVAGVVERETLLELLSLGLADTLPPPLPAPPAILLWPARDRGPGGVLSEWVEGPLEDADEAQEEEEEEGVPRGTLLPPGSPCRP